MKKIFLMKYFRVMKISQLIGLNPVSASITPPPQAKIVGPVNFYK